MCYMFLVKSREPLFKFIYFIYQIYIYIYIYIKEGGEIFEKSREEMAPKSTPLCDKKSLNTLTK